LTVEDWYIDKFNLIWDRPYLAMFRDIYSADLNTEFVRPLKAFFLVKKEFLKDSLEERKKARIDKYYIRKLTKWFNFHKTLFENAEFEILDSGENVSPRFHPKLTIEPNTNPEHLQIFEKRYNEYKAKIGKRYGEYSWLYDSFGWIDWYEFTEEQE
jgi:hypothetical protein